MIRTGGNLGLSGLLSGGGLSIVAPSGSSPGRDYALSLGPVAYYPLESDPSDISGHGNNGTGTGVTYSGTSPVYGESGGAAVFSTASSSKIRCANPLSATPTDVTISAWVKTSAAENSFATLCNSANSLNFIRVASHTSLLYVDAYDGSNYNSVYIGSVSTGSWVQGALTITGSLLKSYLNGTLVGTSAYNATPTLNRFSMGIMDMSSPTGNTDGSLAHVRIYDKALTATEIANQYAYDKDGHL